MMGPKRTATRLLWSWATGRSTRSDPSGTVTKVQGQFNGDRLLDLAKLLQHFGFASLPPANSDLLAVCPSGEPTSALVIATNSQAHRPPAGMQEGDAALYDMRGAYLLMGPNGPVLDAAGLAVTVQNAKSVAVTATDHVTVTSPSVTIAASNTLKLDSPTVEATHALKSDACPSGTFLTKDGHTVTFAGGVITAFI